MAAKKAVVKEVPVVVEVPTPAAAAPAVVVEKRTSGLAIAGIAVGAVIIAGALFGGGVLVGTHIPTAQSQSQFGPGGERPQGGFGGGPNGNGGPGPVMPGQGQSNDNP